ncbi:MAG: fasciclin domain-containing protein [Bacteroidetes bacterium]|nr:fasciclin domain-containing protein [Bacteroidota bacterium]MDA0903131.1 fasciclin domain-containing protein [Bacteroidota bacterium]MDA1242378.1 fasciclin domain-containing protein [Bacteroidota bacterium]
MKHMFIWALGMLLAPLAIAQCEADHTINVQSFSYTPSDLVINQGESVAFINFAGNHDVNGIASTISGENFGNPAEFYLPVVSGMASGVCMGTVTFDVPGTYNYDCSVGQHALNGMVASITVNPVVVSDTTVVDIIVDSPDHTLLEAAVVAAGLVDALSGEGPFTVFAPTDSAITVLTTALGITAEQLLALPTLGDILSYHVVAGLAMSADLSDGQVITTLLGEDVTITITADGVFVNNAQVIVADIVADNGVVHVIDAVLLPAAPQTNTVVDIIAGSPEHTYLAQAVVAAGLDDDLAGEGPFTVFAPTNDALETALEGLGVTLEMFLASPMLEVVLTYHAAAGSVMSGDITDGMMVTMLNGQDITLNITAEGVVINGTALVTVADLTADNGVVHVIDAVLLPAPPQTTTVADIITNSEDHTVLELAVVAAGLDVNLEGEGPFTVFAPTDAAFTTLFETLEVTAEDLLANPDLAGILLYHVASGTVMSTDLSDGMTVTTLNGQDITINITAEGVIINGTALVTVADLTADNGVVHVIDAVLLPPTDDVQEMNVAWTLAPNPAQGQVRLMNVPSTAVVLVRDMTGRVLATLPQGAQTLDVQGWTSGVYFVEWSQGSMHMTQKLVVK